MNNIQVWKYSLRAMTLFSLFDVKLESKYLCNERVHDFLRHKSLYLKPFEMQLLQTILRMLRFWKKISFSMFYANWGIQMFVASINFGTILLWFRSILPQFKIKRWAGLWEYKINCHQNDKMVIKLEILTADTTMVISEVENHFSLLIKCW